MDKGNFMETNLVLEGFKFMGLGMGTVFLFLIVMIFSMNIMSKVLHKFFPEPEVSAAPSTTNAAPQDNKKVIAAITAAIKHHREG
jgi:oxaloacetate decarboxylase gamma subunit